MKMISNKQISKVFYSNCLFEALKAKIKDPKNVKILIVPKKLSKRDGRTRRGFHCFWKIGDLVYDFKCESNVKYFWQMFLFKGYIRVNSYIKYDLMMHWDLEAYLSKISKKYGKKLMFTDPYTTREARRTQESRKPLMETIWNEVKENERIDPLFENEEVQVFYRDKRGKKCIKYTIVHDGKVDIGNHKPLFIKMALWADPIEKINDDEEETQENEQ